MTRGILIAGNESSLFAAAAAEAAKRVESFVSALIPNRFPLPEEGLAPFKQEAAGGAVSLAWNPASPISARTLTLAAENRLGQINDAIVICSPPAVFKSACALSIEEIEILANDHIKSWFFLIREFALYFRRRGGGTLSLVAPENASAGAKDALSKNAPADLLGGAAAAAFRSFAQGVLASSANEPFQAMGFTGPEAGAEGEFASWFFRIVDEGARKNSGRWHSYSKLRLFR